MSAAPARDGRAARAGTPLARPRVGALLPSRRDALQALRAAGAVLACVALAVAVTAAGFAAAARDALDFGFGGVPRTLGEAGAILAHNGRLMGAIAAAAIVVQSLRLERADGALGPRCELARSAVDVVLAVAVAVNAAVVGVAIGAYGGRMVAAMLPHGPVELAAYAFALALYLRAREERLRVGPALRLAAWAVGLLAAAALLEAFLHL